MGLDAKQFGRYISKLRNELNLTIRELDKRSGISHGYISMLETGTRDIPSPNVLKSLSVPLKVDYMHLMKVAGYVTEEINGISEFRLQELEKENRDLREQNALLKEIIKKLTSAL